MNVQSKVIVIALDNKFKKMEKPLKKVVFKLLDASSLSEKTAVEVYLVGNKLLKKNVLAFPAPKNFPRPDLGGRKFLGEIYLNPVYIKNHGENFLYLAIHGFLHLLGYDHKKESDRIKMEKMEQRLLQKLLISNF